jgi:hypothetical protein
MSADDDVTEAAITLSKAALVYGQLLKEILHGTTLSLVERFVVRIFKCRELLLTSAKGFRLRKKNVRKIDF